MANAAAKMKLQKDLSKDPVSRSEITDSLDHATIASRAYELWEARGCPIGSPELDWLQAEEQVRAITLR
jgi:hypothetical protein